MRPTYDVIIQLYLENHMKTKLISAALFATTLAIAPVLGIAARSSTATPIVTQFLAVDGGSIAYDDTGGSGPLILAIPGMGDLRSEYRFIRAALQQAGYRVVTMDVRGYGETKAKWNDYSAHAVGCDALALLDHLKAGPAVILGNSFAAGSAVWAAHDAPTSVSGVVLLGPIMRDQKVSWLTNLTLEAGFAGPWRVWFWTTYWESLFPTKKPADQSQVKEALVQNLREPGRMEALQSMIKLSKADTEAILPHTKVRALVVMGTRDPDFADAKEEAKWLAAQLAADTLIIEGAGHYPHTEMPELVAKKLLPFVAGLNRTRSTNQ